MSMAGPLYLDPELYDDTELGAEVRAAYADGSRIVVMIPRMCSRCGRSVRAQEMCAACGEET